MNVVISLIRFLRSQGASEEMILGAVEAVASARTDDHRSAFELRPQDESAERRRTYDRERQRDKRAAAKACVLGQSADNPPTSAETGTYIEDTSSPSSEQESKEARKKERAKRVSGSLLSADWAPTPKHYLDGDGLGLARQRVDALAADMRDWAEANSHRAVARKSNWNAAFSTWLRRNTGPPDGVKPRTVYEAKQLETMEIMRELRESRLDRASDVPGREAAGILSGYPSDKSARFSDGDDRIVEFLPPSHSRAQR